MGHPKRLDQTAAKRCISSFGLLSSQLLRRQIFNSPIAGLIVFVFLASDMVSAQSKAPAALPNRTSNTLSTLNSRTPAQSGVECDSGISISLFPTRRK